VELKRLVKVRLVKKAKLLKKMRKENLVNK
jgi:hypothetical protein